MALRGQPLIMGEGSVVFFHLHSEGFLSPPVLILHGEHIFIAFCLSVRLSHLIKIHLALSQLCLTTLSEKFMLANGYGVIAVTGRTHFQCQVLLSTLRAKS